tara:strand:- start:9726 stop:10295 length:570 start_codon:yes stop_codon:yes gene_type:complete
MRNRTIVLILLACFLFYLVNSVTEDSDEDTLSLAGSRINQSFDYYMTLVDSTQFNTAGESDYRLQADRIVHYPAPEFAILDSPRLLIYDGQSGPWFLSAAYGTIRQDFERGEESLELSENVVVQHTDNEGRTHNIYTNELTIYLSSRFLTTESEILLESPNLEISSLGMTADLNTKHITFLSEVRGRYD